MDKNSITGLVLIGVVLAIFTYLGRPTEEQLALQQQYQDSLANSAAQQQLTEENAEVPHSMTTEQSMLSDSTLTAAQKDSLLALNHGELAPSATGTEELLMLENDSISYTFNTKGGVPIATELKTYSTFDGQPVRLMKPEDSDFSFTFITRTNRVISSKDLYFTPERVSPTQLRMSAKTTTGGTLNILYTLKSRYMLDVRIYSEGDFAQILAPNAAYLDTHIAIPIYQNEKSAKTEQRYSGFAYEYASGEVEKMNAAKSSNEEPRGTTKWLAFRDMFFSTIVYSPQGLEGVSMTQKVFNDPEDGKIKDLQAKFILPIDRSNASTPIGFTIYSGPNDYSLLRSIEKSMVDDSVNFSHVVDMGSWFRFINVWLIAPTFSFLERFFTNYGVIILLMTIFIKLIVSPFTFKAIQSQAKMRVLRPMVDEINEKYPGQDQMMLRQQKTMELYRSAGVNTLGGCLPMLLQMPFLVAMYQYFPTSINLRGESFLWAKDLSTYDDLISWHGFDLPLIGDHISLFCLLMTVTQVVYMKVTQSTTGGDKQQMAMMKWMTYLMAAMLFVFLNNNAAALSYYYFLSMLISILQTQLFRLAIDEDKVLAQLKENQKKPRKKSKFMQRLEEVQKEQMRRMQDQKKN